MAIAWVLTLPSSALIAYFLSKFAAFTTPVVAYACCIASLAGATFCAGICFEPMFTNVSVWRNHFLQHAIAFSTHVTHPAGLLIWARLVMANAKGREDVEAAVQGQSPAQEPVEASDVRLLPTAARSEEEMGA